MADQMPGKIFRNKFITMNSGQGICWFFCTSLCMKLIDRFQPLSDRSKSPSANLFDAIPVNHIVAVVDATVDVGVDVDGAVGVVADADDKYKPKPVVVCQRE